MSNIDYKLKKTLNLIHLKVCDQKYPVMLKIIEDKIRTSENIFISFINNFTEISSEEIHYTILELYRDAPIGINYENDLKQKEALRLQPLKLTHNNNLTKIIK